MIKCHLIEQRGEMEYKKMRRRREERRKKKHLLPGLLLARLERSAVARATSYPYLEQRAELLQRI